MVILEQNFKWHLEAFAYELFICPQPVLLYQSLLIILCYATGQQ